MPRDLFAVDNPIAHRGYQSARNRSGEGGEAARRNCDELWRDFEPYASEHFLAEFPYRYHDRFFEMYLSVALLRAGLHISCPPAAAPDVRVQYANGRIMWLEAIAPTGGAPSNPDHVAHPTPAPDSPPQAYAVPIDQMILRVRGALHDKARQLRMYRDGGVIRPEDQALIAINVAGIPRASMDAERCALGAVYGVGNPYAVIDPRARAVVQSGHEHRAQLLRCSGAPVDVAPFLHAGHEHVTGALISSAVAASCPERRGIDFMILPNACAAPNYTAHQIPLGREWRLTPGNDPGVFDVEIIEHQPSPPD